MSNTFPIRNHKLESISVPTTTHPLNRDRLVLCVDEKGVTLGKMTAYKAFEMAKEENMILKIVKNSEIPICRFVEKKDFKIDSSRKKDVEIQDKTKEIRFSDTITENDLKIKVNKVISLLLDRFRVKLTVVFKKKQNFDSDMTKAILENIISRVSNISKAESSLNIMDEKRAYIIVKPFTKKKMIDDGIIKPEEEVSKTNKTLEKKQERYRKALQREERVLKTKIEKAKDNKTLKVNPISVREQIRIAKSKNNSEQ